MTRTTLRRSSQFAAWYPEVRLGWVGELSDVHGEGGAALGHVKHGEAGLKAVLIRPGELEVVELIRIEFGAAYVRGEDPVSRPNRAAYPSPAGLTAASSLCSDPFVKRRENLITPPQRPPPGDATHRLPTR